MLLQSALRLILAMDTFVPCAHAYTHARVHTKRLAMEMIQTDAFEMQVARALRQTFNGQINGRVFSTDVGIRPVQQTHAYDMSTTRTPTVLHS